MKCANGKPFAYNYAYITPWKITECFYMVELWPENERAFCLWLGPDDWVPGI